MYKDPLQDAIRIHRRSKGAIWFTDAQRAARALDEAGPDQLQWRVSEGPRWREHLKQAARSLSV